MYWPALLDEIDYEILEMLGEGDPSPHSNPVLEALKKGKVTPDMASLAFFTIKRLARLASICQMVIYDDLGGPDQDRQPKGLRRQWYAWFKIEFAQPYSIILEQDYQDTNWGNRWAGYLSTTFADMVDNENVTYRDLWVKDASRMQRSFYDELFSGANIIFCVEKDSLFEDFVNYANRIGAKTLYSGKGKSSKAAIEKILREHFYWSNHNNPFTEENPLHVIHISDFDYHGEAVIGPTFGEQCKRYTPYVEESRIGIQPYQVQEAGYSLQDKWYLIKQGNKAEKLWATEIALKIVQCSHCQTRLVRESLDPLTCPTCGEITQKPYILQSGYGFEVESMRTSEFIPHIVQALLRILPLEYIITRLREECVADAWEASSQIANHVMENNTTAQELQEELDTIQSRINEFQERVRNEFYRIGADHINDWEDEDEDPTEEAFIEYVQGNNYGPWRPFNTSDRTDSLVQWFYEEQEDLIQDFIDEEF